jgi:hypothetical protein
MFIGPGDTIRGRDGHEWLVIEVKEDNTLTIWRAGYGLWTGRPSGPITVVRLVEEDAINAVMRAFPGASVVGAVGATLASLIGYQQRKAT